MTERLNAYKALSGLDPVVSLHDLEVFLGITRQHAVHIAYKWRLAGYLEAFADEVYFNIVADSKARERHVRMAVEKTLHRPYILVGLSALAEGHWTTQIGRKPELAVAVNRTVRTWKPMSHVTAEGRSVRWFRVAMKNSMIGTDNFRYLDPAYALVDTIMARAAFSELDREQKKAFRARNQGIWHPDADDIDIFDFEDRPDEVVNKLAEATIEFKADHEAVREYLEGQDDVCDHLELFDTILASGTPAVTPR